MKHFIFVSDRTKINHELQTVISPYKEMNKHKCCRIAAAENKIKRTPSVC